MKNQIENHDDDQKECRKDITGLCGLAIVFIVTFGAYPILRGGFIGVDILFVVSGFFISQSILKNLQGKKFDLLSFYFGYIRRFFPALILILVFSFVVGWFLFDPDEYKQLGEGILASAGFFQNILKFQQLGVFDPPFDPSTRFEPLLHLWMLGVVGQFILVYPLIIWGAWRLGLNLISLSIILILISFLANLKGVDSDITKTFFSLQTRFWELAVGSVFVFIKYFKQEYVTKSLGWINRVIFHPTVFNIPPLIERREHVIKNIFSVFGLTLVCLSLIGIYRDRLYPGWWALVPVFGALCIILSGPKALVNRSILSNYFLVHLGKISYPLYLWHWILLSFLRLIDPEVPSEWVRLAAISIGVLLALLTYLLIERPFRNNINIKTKGFLLILCMCFVGFIGYNCFIRKGYEFRHVYLLNTSVEELVGSTSNTTWLRSNANDKSDKFSTIYQINKKNIDKLSVAWTYHSGSIAPSQTNPIFAEGKLFTVVPNVGLVSLDPKTGISLWKTALPTGKVRGITYHNGYVYVPTNQGIYVVNAKDGGINTAYGKNGVLGNTLSFLPPIIKGNSVFTANYVSTIESWDLKSGKNKWTTKLEKNGNIARMWSGFSYDQESNLLFVVTANVGGISPQPNMSDGGYSCSLIAIDAKTGEIRWQFQEIMHETWDLDMVGPPVITSINHQGKKISVVAAVSKSGNVILVDKLTGQSIFGYTYQQTPDSDPPGAKPARQQIKINLPEPFSDTYYDTNLELKNMSLEQAEYVKFKLRNARFDRFTPLTTKHDVALFGLHGGAQWPGSAVDQRTATLVVPSNRVPWILRNNYTDNTKEKISKNLAASSSIYKTKCSNCHGSDLNGGHQNEIQNPAAWADSYVPSLIGITKKRSKYELVSYEKFSYFHKYSKDKDGILIKASIDELENLYSLFSKIDRELEQRNGLGESAFWQYLLDKDHLPASAPPWGFITAIDLNTGKTKWKKPFGLARNPVNGKIYEGDFNIGGLIITAANLIFAGGTRDEYARAFDLESGDEIWKAKMPSAVSAPPMTYEHEGCQYVVFNATGGYMAGFLTQSDSTVAYKLSDCNPKR